MKRMICFGMALALLVLSLAACGTSGTGGQSGDAAPEQNQTSAAPQGEDKVVRGIINRIGNCLVLLLDDGEYQIMDYGEGITMDGFAEGDTVDVTYTGQLEVEGSTPVITAIVKVQ